MAERKIDYYVGDGRGSGPDAGPDAGPDSTSTQIAAWVAETFTASTAVVGPSTT